MAKKARLEIRIEEDTKGILQLLAEEKALDGTVTQLLMEYIDAVTEQYKAQHPNWEYALRVLKGE